MSDGGLIPVQHGPPKEDAVFLLRCTGKAGKKRLADSAPAQNKTDKEILEIQSSASPSGVVAKEDRKARGLSAPFGN